MQSRPRETTSSHNLSRRDALRILASTGIATVLGVPTNGEAATAGTTPRPSRAMKPLPFDPKKLDGLSERLVVSHHENNYGGAVKRLNLIEQQIAALPADAAPFRMGSLKREGLIARNSAVLHELYFANLGGNGGPGGAVASKLRQDFGSAEAWERDFRLTGMSLAGGSGWVLLCIDDETGRCFNAWSWDHGHFPAGAKPLLVMDMYEHSYHLDYGAEAKAYVDAFFRNVAWTEVERRLVAAR